MSANPRPEVLCHVSLARSGTTAKRESELIVGTDCITCGNAFINTGANNAQTTFVEGAFAAAASHNNSDDTADNTAVNPLPIQAALSTVSSGQKRTHAATRPRTESEWIGALCHKIVSKLRNGVDVTSLGHGAAGTGKTSVLLGNSLSTFHPFQQQEHHHHHHHHQQHAQSVAADSSVLLGVLSRLFGDGVSPCRLLVSACEVRPVPATASAATSASSSLLFNTSAASLASSAEAASLVPAECVYDLMSSEYVDVVAPDDASQDESAASTAAAATRDFFCPLTLHAIPVGRYVRCDSLQQTMQLLVAGLKNSASWAATPPYSDTGSGGGGFSSLLGDEGDLSSFEGRGGEIVFSRRGNKAHTVLTFLVESGDGAHSVWQLIDVAGPHIFDFKATPSSFLSFCTEKDVHALVHSVTEEGRSSTSAGNNSNSSSANTSLILDQREQQTHAHDASVASSAGTTTATTGGGGGYAPRSAVGRLLHKLCRTTLLTLLVFLRIDRDFDALNARCIEVGDRVQRKLRAFYPLRGRRELLVSRLFEVLDDSNSSGDGGGRAKRVLDSDEVLRFLDGKSSIWNARLTLLNNRTAPQQQQQQQHATMLLHHSHTNQLNDERDVGHEWSAASNYIFDDASEVHSTQSQSQSHTQQQRSVLPHEAASLVHDPVLLDIESQTREVERRLANSRQGKAAAHAAMTTTTTQRDPPVSSSSFSGVEDADLSSVVDPTANRTTRTRSAIKTAEYTDSSVAPRSSSAQQSTSEDVEQQQHPHKDKKKASIKMNEQSTKTKKTKQNAASWEEGTLTPHTTEEEEEVVEASTTSALRPTTQHRQEELQRNRGANEQQQEEEGDEQEDSDEEDRRRRERIQRKIERVFDKERNKKQWQSTLRGNNRSRSGGGGSHNTTANTSVIYNSVNHDKQCGLSLSTTARGEQRRPASATRGREWISNTNIPFGSANSSLHNRSTARRSASNNSSSAVPSRLSATRKPDQKQRTSMLRPNVRQLDAFNKEVVSTGGRGGVGRSGFTSEAKRLKQRTVTTQQRQKQEYDEYHSAVSVDDYDAVAEAANNASALSQHEIDANDNNNNNNNNNNQNESQGTGVFSSVSSPSRIAQASHIMRDRQRLLQNTSGFVDDEATAVQRLSSQMQMLERECENLRAETLFAEKALVRVVEPVMEHFEAETANIIAEAQQQRERDRQLIDQMTRRPVADGADASSVSLNDTNDVAAATTEFSSTSLPAAHRRIRFLEKRLVAAHDTIAHYQSESLESRRKNHHSQAFQKILNQTGTYFAQLSRRTAQAEKRAQVAEEDLAVAVSEVHVLRQALDGSRRREEQLVAWTDQLRRDNDVYIKKLMADDAEAKVLKLLGCASGAASVTAHSGQEEEEGGKGKAGGGVVNLRFKAALERAFMDVAAAAHRPINEGAQFLETLARSSSSSSSSSSYATASKAAAIAKDMRQRQEWLSHTLEKLHEELRSVQYDVLDAAMRERQYINTIVGGGGGGNKRQ